MIYDLWYRVSRTVFPFISLRRYYEICDDYDALIDKQFDCIARKEQNIQELHNELDAMQYPESSWELPDSVEKFEPITGKSVEASGVFYVTITDEEDIARMDNEGPVNPAQWEKDVCNVRQPHWGWPCTRSVHNPDSAHIHFRNGVVVTTWWDTNG